MEINIEINNPCKENEGKKDTETGECMGVGVAWGVVVVGEIERRENQSVSGAHYPVRIDIR